MNQIALLAGSVVAARPDSDARLQQILIKRAPR
jgi:hypothetical protein